MAHYMAEMVLDHHPVLIIGGGSVARRKVRGLLVTQAKITVVAPDLIEDLAALHAQGRITWLEQPYSPDLLTGNPRPLLTFAATGSAHLNRQIAAHCADRGMLCNSADGADVSGFLVPATVRRGAVTIGVGTTGKSPALSRLIKERIDAWLDPGWGAMADLFGEMRSLVQSHFKEPKERYAFWRAIALEIDSERLGRSVEENRRWFMGWLGRG